MEACSAYFRLCTMFTAWMPNSPKPTSLADVEKLRGHIVQDRSIPRSELQVLGRIASALRNPPPAFLEMYPFVPGPLPKKLRYDNRKQQVFRGRELLDALEKPLTFRGYLVLNKTHRRTVRIPVAVELARQGDQVVVEKAEILHE